MTTRTPCILLAALACWSMVGCAMWRTAPSLPEQHTVVREQLVLHSDFPLPQRHRLVEELVAQRAALSAKLGLPLSDEPIHVYLFATQDKFRAFMKARYPDLPDRRAFFVENDTRLMVFAYWGERVAEDLRHEVAHGYLHSLVPHIPLWLDEGLAEYFEVPRSDRGLNAPHVRQLNAAFEQGQHPNLQRLEQLAAAEEMTQIDYAESWAWVHLMLESSPDTAQVLRSHLQLLMRGEPAEPLSNHLSRLHVDGPRRVQDHVQVLAQSLR